MGFFLNICFSTPKENYLKKRCDSSHSVYNLFLIVETTMVRTDSIPSIDWKNFWKCVCFSSTQLIEY